MIPFNVPFLLSRNKHGQLCAIELAVPGPAAGPLVSSFLVSVACNSTLAFTTSIHIMLRVFGVGGIYLL